MIKSKRMLCLLLLAALAMELFSAGAAHAESDWKSAYLKALKQAGGRREIALMDLTGDGLPELAVLSTDPSKEASLKVYTMDEGQLSQLVFKGNQLARTGVKAASMALRLGSGKQACLSVSLLGVEGKRAFSLRLGFTANDAGGLGVTFDSSRIKQAGKTKYYLGGGSVSSATYARRGRAYESSYKKNGSLPQREIAKGDRATAVESKFKALVKSYTAYSTVKSVKLSRTTATLTAGKTVKLSASVSPSTAGMGTISWSSSDENLATVDKSGKVSALRAGRVVVTAKAKSGAKRSCAITIKGPPPTGVEISDAVLTLVKGETAQLTGAVLPEGASQTLSWSSSNKTVATVDKAGLVTGNAKGRATITAKTSNGKSKVCKVVVNDGPAVIIDISQHNYSAGIDWKKVADSVHLVIIRCGVTRTDTKPIGVGKDDKFEYFAKKCREYDIPFGVYFYGKCSDEETARAEAQMTWDVASPYDPLFYVYDVEESRLNRNLIETYIRQLKNLGAKRTGLYIAHHLYSKYKLDTAMVDFTWIPHYGKNTGTVNSTPSYPCDLHQYTSVGKIAGFPGGVDVSRLMGGKSLAWFLGGK